MIVVLLIYAFEDATFGLISSGIGFFSTIASFFLGLAFYHPVSNFLSHQLELTKGISDAFSFFLVTIISYIAASTLLTVVRSKYGKIDLPKGLDKAGGAIFGVLSFFFIASFAVSLLLSLPVSNVIKNSIRNSVTGKFMSSGTQAFEGYARQIFGGAIEDSINFLTVEPDSNEAVNLNFKTANYKVDPAAEEKMLSLVNEQRKANGAPPLVTNISLSNLARDHAKDMVERGYFSHYTPEGLSPFDRMAEANISYQYAGENLAFAPDVQIAMDGLMKSPGHRANILSNNFGKIGIGVIDAGIYGEMFVQEFTD